MAEEPEADQVWLEEAASLITTSAGFTLRGKKSFRIEAAVRNHMTRLGLHSLPEYVSRLRTAQGKPLLDELIESVTVNETCFFRHPEQFELLRDRMNRSSPPTEQDPLRVLSAACSTGEEVYSLAMVLADGFPGLGPKEMSVTGIDIDAKALEAARQATYVDWTVSRSQFPPYVLGRHLVSGPDGWNVSEPIRRLATFDRKNLLADDLGGPYHVIFCRNVLIYFEGERRQAVIDNLVRSLVDGGLLFCGCAETLSDQPRHLERREENGVIFYRRQRGEPSSVSLGACRNGPDPALRPCSGRPFDGAQGERSSSVRGERLFSVRGERLFSVRGEPVEPRFLSDPNAVADRSPDPPSTKAMNPADPTFRYLPVAEAAVPPRLVIAGAWPEEPGPKLRAKFVECLAHIVHQSSKAPWSHPEGGGKVILDLSGLHFAEGWLAKTLLRFGQALRPTKLTVEGHVGAFRWLSRHGLSDLV